MEAEVGGIIYNDPLVNEGEKSSEGMLHDSGLLALILDTVSEYNELIIRVFNRPRCFLQAIRFFG